uniref:Uncharacterized protein n=1 Tax=Anguilla anguilla TaxID=7936 RepID=A0A0E9S5R1_ANGAN
MKYDIHHFLTSVAIVFHQYIFSAYKDHSYWCQVRGKKGDESSVIILGQCSVEHVFMCKCYLMCTCLRSNNTICDPCRYTLVTSKKM